MEEESGLSEREVRRRRIAARSADRMAFITGKIKTISPSSSPKSSPRHHYRQSPSSSPHSHHSRSQSFPNFDFSPHQQQHFNLQAGLENEIDKPSGHALKPDSASQVEPQLRKCETNTEATRGTFTAELEKKLPPPSLVTASLPKEQDNRELKEPDNTEPKESDNTEPLSKPGGVKCNFCTLKDINTCIIFSENMRVFCSIMIALLVVLSYMNLPRKIVKSKSVIASTPLYVLLLTDLTIVIGRLILEKRRGTESPKEEQEEPGDQMDGHNWGGAVKVLEMGIVLHQTLRAVFIDCSFYMVIVICGLSLI
ncbi:hypothetical protein LguiA_028651 [Lonicera macranthoides]